MALKDWVAPSKDVFTAVVNPVFIEDKLRDDLITYHPRPIDNKRMMFRLDAITDSAGDYAGFVTKGSVWDKSWVDLLGRLRLRPAMDSDGKEILLDDSPVREALGSTNWTPTRWRIEKTMGFDNQDLFQEIIDWENLDDGQTAISIYSWIPY